jgi:hypothetical protein
MNLYLIINSKIDITTSRQMAKDVFGISNQRHSDINGTKNKSLNIIPNDLCNISKFF